MTDLFLSSEKYKNIFNDGIINMAQDGGLGTFILAMANATFDKEIFAATKDILNINFLQLSNEYINYLTGGRKINVVDEDLLVFLKMICVGFDQLQTTTFRNESDWELQFNHVRGFRPNRMSQHKVHNLFEDFTSSEFNFNKPFMAKERLWEGEYRDNQISLYYNKYPFTNYHTLLVPERKKELPQYLQLSYHNMVWHFLESIGEKIKGVGMGYNSRGAFSSVNHLHFQLFIRDKSLPVTDAKWLHNGGNEIYPVTCYVFSNNKESGEFIENLNKNNTAYNLLYFPGKVYCLPRKMQGSYQHAEWTPGFSWYELAGGLLMANKDNFDGLTTDEIKHEFSLLNLN